MRQSPLARQLLWTLVVVVSSSSTFSKDMDRARDWKTGFVRRVTEVKRFIPAVEQPLRGVVGDWGMSTDVETGVTRRLAVYTIEVGSHVYVLEEELKGKAQPTAFDTNASVRFAIGESDRAWFLDHSGKEHKARLTVDTLRRDAPIELRRDTAPADDRR